MNNPLINILIGVFLTILGLGVSTYASLSIVDTRTLLPSVFDGGLFEEREMPNLATAGGRASCEAAMKDIGLRTSVEGKRITGVMHSFESPESALSKTSLAVMYCQGHKMESFCMGADCNRPVEISLVPK